MRRFISFVILTFVIFLCLCSRDLHVLFVLFSILPILFRFFPCDPFVVCLLFATLFYLVPSFRARVVHAFVFLVGTEAVSRDGLERDLGESKMGSTSGLRASGINASM